MDIEKIKHIAEICYLNFEEEKLLKFKDDFLDTFELVSKIKNIDTANIEPSNKVIDVSTVLADDSIKDGLTKEETFKNAPESEYDYFKVVRFVD
ncbi:MAG: Asp-tRNA(Asn)/Glu-tRNA(Gln) amidotransferase subunit GatC [Tissierellia bacterium]|nr:Asp-tRNA(Asn)/Glu-tRNA(Gln) amidotransferase subunit GatC [Tissierellia bacterium]